MPRVPTLDTFRASVSGGPGGQFTVPNAPGAGEIAATQIGQAAQALGKAGDAAERMAMDWQAEANETDFKAIDNDVTAKLDSLQFAPDSGFMSLLGKNASSSLREYVDKTREILDQAVLSAPNQQVKSALKRVVGQRLESIHRSMSQHAASEFQKHRLQTSENRAKVSLLAGAHDFRNDDAFNGNLGTALLEVETQGDLRGWDVSTVALQKQNYIDEAYRLRYASARIQDPVGALSHFQHHQGAISPLVRDQLYHQLFEAAAPSLALQLNAAGGVGVVQSPDTNSKAPAPRGIRNNNPGNIVRTDTQWQGEVQGNDPRFASFSTPEAGIRAMGKTLLAYQDKHGLNTVSGIISRWAPATENDPVSYAKQVATGMGIKPDQPVDLHDTDTLASLAKAMIKAENGQQPYTDQQIKQGLAMVKGAAPSPSPSVPGKAGSVSTGSADAWRNPDNPTGIPAIDALPSAFKLHVLQAARSQAHQDMAAARDSLRAKVQDASAAYMANGIAPNPPPLSEFIRAFGQADGPTEYASFQRTAKLGAQIHQVKTLPANALADLAQQAKPVAGPGFAEAQHNYEILTQAIDRTNQARQADPVAYAQAVGGYGIKHMESFSNLKTFGQEMSRRAAAAPRMALDYGTPPALLSKSESRALADTLRAAPVEQQKQYLGTLARSLDNIDLLKSTMQSIAPDQPVLAMAGVYQARGRRTTEGRDVADLMLRGQAILAPNKKTDGSGHDGGASLLKMPEEKLLLSEFNARTDGAFSGKEKARDLFMQAARAIYAAKSAEEGDYSGNIDGARWKSAINMATGGLQDHNGSRIVMPYGMSYDKFRDDLKAQVDTLAPTALATQPAEMMRLPLENVGDGRYLFRRGAGYLVGKDGKPVEVRITSR